MKSIKTDKPTLTRERKTRKKRTTKKNETTIKNLSTEQINEKIEKDYEQMFKDSVEVPEAESFKDSAEKIIEIADKYDKKEEPKINEQIEIKKISGNEVLKKVQKQSKRDYIILKIHDLTINDLMIIINDIVNNDFINKNKTSRKALIKDILTKFKDSKEETKNLKVSDLLIKNVNKLINFYLSINETFKEDDIKKIIISLAENNFI